MSDQIKDIREDSGGAQEEHRSRFVYTREFIITCLEKNQAQHTAILEEAEKTYIETALSILNTRINILKKGKVVDVSINLIVPVGYSHAYDNALRMFRGMENRTIALTESQFLRFVRDEWPWSMKFYTSVLVHSPKAQVLFFQSDASLQEV